MNLAQIMHLANSGTLDAKKEVLAMLQRMSPQQRQAMRGIIPQVKKLAQEAGFALGNFEDDVSSHL